MDFGKNDTVVSFGANDQVMGAEDEIISGPKKKTSWKEDLAISFAGVGNTFDTMGTLAWSLPAATERKDEMYKNLNERLKQRTEWANPEKKNQTFGGKLLGTVGTLPMQMIAMGASPVETGKTFLDQGETLPRAFGAAGADFVGNAAGMLLPIPGANKVTNVLGNAALNAGQDAASRAIISAVAEKQSTKDIFAPTLETTGIAGVVGGGFGLTKPSAKPQADRAPLKPDDIRNIITGSKNDPVVETPDMRLESPVAADIRVEQQNRQMPKAEDYNNRDANVRAVEEEIAAFEAYQRSEAQKKAAMDEAAETQKNMEFQKAQQMQIDDHPYGDPPPQYGFTPEFGRIDDNGIPIRADLSMEAANLENPLQRNLWGDELPGRNTQDQSIGMTQALDNIPPGPERDRAVSMLSGVGKKQGGMVDLEMLVPKKFLDFVTKWKQAGGNFSHVGVSRMLDDNPVNLTEFQRTLLSAEFPETVKTYEERIARAVENNDFAKAQRMYKRMDDALIGDAVTKHFDAFGSGFTLEGPSYNAKTGRMAGQVAARENADAAINIARTPFKGPGKKQAGGVDFKAIEDWLTGKSRVGGSMSSTLPKIDTLELDTNRQPRPDTIQTPRSPKTLAAKTRAKKVADITGIGKDIYSDVKTIEEALSNPGNDIMKNPVRDLTTPGLESMVRTNPNNSIIRFARSVITDARNAAEKYSKTFVTGDTGVNTLYRKLSKPEWVDVSQTLMIASQEKTALTRDMMAKLGFNENQMKFVERLREALDQMHQDANSALKAQGFKELDYRPGYVPSMFSGAYTSLVGHYVTRDNGKKFFKITGVAQGDTKAQHKAALEYYKGKGDQFQEVVTLPFRGLRDGANRANRVFDGFNDLVNVIAQHDVDFAEVKAAADAYAAGKIKDLYKFDVHEKKKTGVVGSMGDRPWLDAQRNSEEFLEGLVNYLEEGSRYYNYQGALNDVGKLTRNEKLAVTHPNTLGYLEKYVRNATGQGISPMGSGLNWMINQAAKSLGHSPEAYGKNINRAMSAMSAMMMGIMNIPFFVTQLSQPVISGIPEGLRVGQATGKSFSSSLTSVAQFIPIVSLDNMMGTKFAEKFVPLHIRNAMKYAENAGMLSFSEAELAHEVMQSKTERILQGIGHWPSVLAERLTRPPVFLTYADMFVKAGYPEAEAFKKAQYATDYAMVNYHPDERPMLYNTFGMMGRFMGALTTYKHNLGHGIYSRGEDVVKGRSYAPAVAAVAAMYLAYGISGIMGYEEADQAYRTVTGESIKHAVLGDDLVESATWHGLLSAKSGIDFQSRLSMASALPDTVMGAISPQGSVAADILLKAYDAAKNQDTASFEQLAYGLTPSGMKGFTEQKLLVEDGFLMNKDGKRKFDTPRSEKEQKLRAAVGFKPLRERLESDDVYRRTTQEKKRSDKIKTASQRFSIALDKADDYGASKHMDDYIENGGDPRSLLTSQKAKTWYVNKYKSERGRQEGVPNANINQLNRYEGFQQ